MIRYSPFLLLCMMLMASITTVTKLETTSGEQITDLGTIFLEKKAYYAEISVYSPIIMAVIENEPRSSLRW